MATSEDLIKVINYIKTRYGDPFTGSVGLQGFQQKISDVLILGEIGDLRVAYRFSHAVVGKSSFSFGAAQWDIGSFGPMSPPGSKTSLVVDQNPQYASRDRIGMMMLEQILRGAVDAEGAQIVSETQIEEIIVDILGSDGGKAIANPYAFGLVSLIDGVETIPLLNLVNAALNSEYGKQQINIWHQQHMADLEAHVNYVVNSVTDIDRRTFLQGSLAARLFFADVRNQYGPLRGRIELTQYLNSSVSNPAYIRIDPRRPTPTIRLAVSGDALGYDDILNFFFGIPASFANARNDRIRRFGHIVASAAEQLDSSALDDEAAKGLVRLYQDYLKGYEQAYGFQEINYRLINPAREYLIDTYVQEKGYSVTINGRVIVGEDPTTFTRNPKHFSAHDWLVGTKDNDLIFGDGGNDTIFSSGGSDVLYGGKGNDTYVIQNFGDGGQTRIEDKEGDNTIVFNGFALKYFVKKSGETVWEDLDKRFTAVKQGHGPPCYRHGSG